VTEATNPDCCEPTQAGRFRLDGEIARGGMGAVYRATDTALGRVVAVKVLQEKFALDSGTARRFTTEVQITAQLQHPAIPPVHDFGTLPDGRPFLAMKLIKGSTLDHLLRQRTDCSAERGRFLAIFEQVCQAVAYAHAHQVIHRDLKPSNVMVGGFGEVQVMDWGLAKTVGGAATVGGAGGDPEAATAESVIREADTEESRAAGTQAGSILGTLAYMPPEQAAGEVNKVDPRSDVFGLGAILAVILTGSPPYVGSDAEAVRVMAIRGDQAACHARLEGCGAEAELVGLCRRCLAFAPQERPADADEVARAVAALRAAADERARRAELDRVKAEGEVREAEARAAEQRQRRQILLIASGIIALVLLAGLSASLWQMRRAMQAEATANTNADEARDNAEQAERNAIQARLERDAKAVALAAEQKAREDETRARQQAFAALRSITAEVVERKFAQGTGLTEDDRAYLRGIIAQFDAFAAIKGDDVDSRAVRAVGRAQVGLMRHRLGELEEAEKDFNQALSIFKQLSAEFPSRPEIRHELADSHNNRGTLLHATGRFQEAEEDFDQALSIFKQLAADFLHGPNHRRDLGISHNNRALLLRDTGRFQEAEKDWNEAVSIYKQLAAEFPTQPEFRQKLAGSHLNQANLLHRTGRLQEAEKGYDLALSIHKQLAADYPSRPEFHQELGRDHISRGALLSETGRFQEAKMDFDRALSIFMQLAADFPSRPDFRQNLAYSHNNLGTLLSQTGRVQEADKEWSLALSIRRQLAADFPTRPGLRHELASSHRDRGDLLRDMGRFQEAEKEYDQAVSILKQLAASFPTRLEFRQDLAGSHNNRALLLGPTGRRQEAEKDFDQALSIYKQLAADFPNKPDLHSELAGTCVNLALLHQQQGNGAAAKRLLLEGRPHHLAALKANPRHPDYRQFYHNHLIVLTEVHAGLLEQEDAVRTAENRRDLGWNVSADAYNAARFLSLCVPIVAKHDKLDARQRQEAAQFYADAAMKLLRDAVSKGYRDAMQMKKDTGLGPLRPREDFRNLIKQVEAKAAANPASGRPHD
jgi:tetratricopeptide (TPR) repeat protein